MKIPLFGLSKVGFVAAFFIGALTGQAQTLVYSNIWSIAPNSRPYVTSGATERGIAISPLNNNVFIVSRAPAVGAHGAIYILNGETGAELTNEFGVPLTLSTNGISGGTLLLNAIGVADDGAIYACNLGPSALKVYRWADENSEPTVAYGPLAVGTMTRLGDTMDVRGAGVDTQIIVSGSANAGFAVLTTLDGVTFTATGCTTPAGTSAGDFGKGIAFGSGNTAYGKKDTVTTIRNVSFDPFTADSAALIGDVPADLAMGPLDLDESRNLLGGILLGGAGASTLHKFKIYDISNPASPQVAATFSFPSSAFNGQLVGAVDYKTNKFVAVDTANGVVCVRVDISFLPTPPTITLHPQNQEVLSGGFVTFSSDATGALPLSYQWYYNSNVINNATNKTYFLDVVEAANAGNFHVVVTNEGGFAKSSNAVLSVIPSESTGFATNAWSLGAGSRPYLTSTTLQRGMAYNPGSDSVLVQSGSVIGGPPQIYVLNAATGADRHQMDMTGVSGNYFPLNVIAAAEDGVVYGLNMTLRGEAMKLYRWENDQPGTVPTLAYGPANVWGEGIIDDLNRLGDTINIRGRGTNTQIIATANGYSKAVIFTTTDGFNFTATPIIITNAPANVNYQVRLGVAFGSGDTFWAKGLRDDANGRTDDAPLRNIAFNLASGTAEIVHTYNTARDTMSAIGVEVQNDILAGLNFGTPDSIKVFDISDINAEPPVRDQDFYATDNANQFFTGAFDSGGGRLYSLNTGNGLLCLKIRDAIPTIVQQPTSRTNAVGTRAIFNVKSTGYPRNSRWQFNGVDIPGANTSTLTLHNVRGTNAGNYRLIITNSLGSVTSSVVALRVAAGIIAHPVDQVVNAGEPATLTVEAEGEPLLSYQWKLNGTNVPGGTTSSLNFPSAQLANAGNYTVTVTNSYGVANSQSALLTVVIPSTPGTGTGLTGDYWSDQTNTFAGSPAVTVTDPTIDYDWVDGPPYLSMNPDYFTVRWSGQVEPLYSQTYTFYAATDNGVKLIINGQVLINQFGLNQVVNSSGTIALNANQKYNIIMEYAENTGNASAHLSWSSLSQVKEIIPQIQLYPTLGAAPPTLGATVSGPNLVFTWDGSHSLQTSTNVAGPYIDVGGATSPHTNSIAGEPQRYFRLFSN